MTPAEDCIVIIPMNGYMKRILMKMIDLLLISLYVIQAYRIVKCTAQALLKITAERPDAVIEALAF